MRKGEIIQEFVRLFPNFAEAATGYKKIGSNVIVVKFENAKSLVFLYINDGNWSFGTKLWRKRPDRLGSQSKKMLEIGESIHKGIEDSIREEV